MTQWGNDSDHLEFFNLCLNVSTGVFCNPLLSERGGRRNWESNCHRGTADSLEARNGWACRKCHLFSHGKNQSVKSIDKYNATGTSSIFCVQPMIRIPLLMFQPVLCETICEMPMLYTSVCSLHVIPFCRMCLQLNKLFFQAESVSMLASLPEGDPHRELLLLLDRSALVTDRMGAPRLQPPPDKKWHFVAQPR